MGLGSFPHRTSKTITGRVFDSLSPLHRAVLWNIDVEHLPVKEVTKILGILPKEVVLALVAARSRFCDRWVEMQGRSNSLHPACRKFMPRFQGYNRGQGSAHQREEIQQHLKLCMRCAILTQESQYLSLHLEVALAPALTPDFKLESSS